MDDHLKIGFGRIHPEEDVNPEFAKWCEFMGLYWISGGYFYAPDPALSSDWFPPHIDGHSIMDWCKANWCLGGGKNSMKWYTPKENFELVPKTSLKSVATRHSMIDPDQIELAYETVHDENCLINAGRIHSFHSSSNPQHIVSVVLGRKKTNKVIMWDEIPEVFGDYIVQSDSNDNK